MFFLVSHSSAGGAQEIWVNLAEAFRARGRPVQLLALYPLRETVRETPADLPWRYVVPTRPRSPLAGLRMMRALVRLIRHERPAAIFTAMPAANVVAGLAARIAGGDTKVVISHHSPIETHNPVLNRIDGMVGSLNSVQTVVSVSNSVSATLDRKPARYRRKRQTIHNALPPSIEALLSVLQAQQGATPRSARKLVATGRLAAQKNYPLLIRAAAHMPDVEIDIIGTGPDEAELQRLAHTSGVTDRVRFLGHRPRAEAMALLASARVFVQASLFEGHSLALIEAAKLGLPLVVSDVPVQIEAITAADGTRCGIAIGVNDDQALAREVLRLMDDPVHHALWADRSRKLAEEATFDAMVGAYERLAGQ
jgi:glycosyltransferase involved in cell wall biosynthesis